MRRTVKREADRLDAWAEGYLLGLLFRAALSPHGLGTPVPLADLRAAGPERYATILERVGRWRSGEAWAVVLCEQVNGVYCELGRGHATASYGAPAMRKKLWRS